MRFIGCAIACAALAGLVAAQLPQNNERPKRLLAIAATKGFEHDSANYALGTLWELGKQSGLWETYLRTDTELITKKKLEKNAKNLDYFDAVYFFTTGELDLDDEQKAALISFVKDDGKGFIGGHSATDTFFHWAEYGDMVGGYFDTHPWNTLSVGLNVEDRTFPATKHLPEKLTVLDEIYQVKGLDREKNHVLISLDTATVDMTNPRVHQKDFPVAWEKTYGRGRVFMCTLGHTEQAYDRPDMRKMYLEAVKWALGITK